MTSASSDRQRVLVTGASRGIGRAVARVLVQRAHDVLGTSRHPEDLQDPEPGVTFVELDLEREESIDSCIRRVERVDVLINNAGRSQIGAAEDLPLSDVRSDFMVNLFGPMRLIQAFLPAMRERGRGAIVNVGSMVGRFAIPFQSVYTSSKFALAGYSWSLRSEVRPHGIKVAVIEPNDISTTIEPRLTLPGGSAYREAVLKVKTSREKRMSGSHDPETVARKVLRILDDPDPAPFHVVGGKGPLMVFLKRFLPERTVEKLVRDTYGLE